MKKKHLSDSRAMHRFQTDRRRLLAGTSTLAFSALGLWADPAFASEDTTIEWLKLKNMSSQVEFSRVGIVAGDPGGTYFSVANDLRIAIGELDAKTSQRIVPMVNAGSQETVTDLLFLKGTELGILQADVMSEIRNLADQGYPQAKLAKKWIRYVTRLYDEEVHLLSAGFDKLEELKNATVNVGSKGSGTHYTAESILQAAGLSGAVKKMYLGKEKAFAELKAGRLDAMFIVAGQPVREFAALGGQKKSEHFTLIPIDVDVGSEYTKTTLSKITYPIIKAKSIQTLSVASVLVAYDFKDGPRREKLRRFCNAFRKVQDELRENSSSDGLYHSKWQEYFNNKNFISRVPSLERLRFMEKRKPKK